MLGVKIGSLIMILTDVELIDGTKIIEGDIGVIIGCIEENPNPNLRNFDYLVLVNGIELFVFSNEIELYT